MSSAGTPARIDAALAAITTEVFRHADVPRAMAVGCSGGLDSSVLLEAAQRHAAQHGIRLHAFHVHHGLASQADAWQDHVREQAARRGVAFDARRILLERRGASIEEAARGGRYAALGALCRLHAVPLLLTAHHQDDQAETVLLQLLRGSGVAGLSGMDACNAAPSLLGDPSLLMARPLLAFSRAELQQLADDWTLAYIDDPSNADPRFARNALRHQVMPALEAAFPGFAQRFARSARHAQAAQSLLVALAQEDFSRCAEGESLLLDRLRPLEDARIDNLLRYWFGRNGMRMPSTSWLQQLRRQVFGAKPDAQILIGHPDCEIHRHRNRIVMTRHATHPDAARSPRRFNWDGQPSMAFPDFGGVLHFMPAEEGIDAGWLRDQMLAIQWRGPGFRLKLAANRPSRSLKHHYQAANVPAWQRTRLPLVTIAPAAEPMHADGDPDTGSDAVWLALESSHPATSAPLSSLPPLLFAAGIGMDCQHVGSGGQRVALRWQDDAEQTR